MDNIIDGKKVSSYLRDKLKEEITENNINACLCVIQVGDNPASNIYVRNKSKACSSVGIDFKLFKFEEDIKEDIIINKIKELNEDASVNGILVQLPLPNNFDSGNIINTINPLKDVDGLTYENVGNLVLENECLVSCTPLGIITLLEEYDVDLFGKNVCIIGRSNLVGKPLIQLLLQKNATVTVCHSKSKDIKEFTKLADVLIVAAGCPKLVTKDMVKDDVVVIDVGINKNNDFLCGDVDFDEVSKKASLITPVPGGVGPMTITSLLFNVIKAYKLQNRR